MSLAEMLLDNPVTRLFSRIIPKRSNVAGHIPTANDLEPGELAVNLVDKKLYSKNEDGEVFVLSSSDATLTATKITDPGDILD